MAVLPRRSTVSSVAPVCQALISHIPVSVAMPSVTACTVTAISAAAR
jgi:hypothetical protein